MLHTVTAVTGGMLWANLHLLFWLSLFPFTTGWMGENHFTPIPTALYGVVLLMAAIAYYVLQEVIIRAQGPNSVLKKAVGHDWKGRLSPITLFSNDRCRPLFPFDLPNNLRSRGAYVADSGPTYQEHPVAERCLVSSTDAAK